MMARIAVVIGGTRQIGRAMAVRLLVGGWTVRLVSRGRCTDAAGLVKLGAEHIRMDRDESGTLSSRSL